jgi:hypothetical protein
VPSGHAGTHRAQYPDCIVNVNYRRTRRLEFFCGLVWNCCVKGAEAKENLNLGLRFH